MNAKQRAAAAVLLKLAPSGEPPVATIARQLLFPDNTIALQLNADGTITFPSLAGSTIAGNSSVSGTLTVTGATALGTTTIAAATTPSITTAAGKTNTGFVQINGKTSGALKLLPVDAAGQTVTVSLAAQTSGASTLTIPDCAGVAQSFIFTALTQTLTNKTLTAPTIAAYTITGTGTIGAGLTATSPTLITPAIGAATGTSLVLTAGVRFTPTVYTSDGAITLASGTHLIEKTSAAAMTVAAPSSQDGERLEIISNTDFAHVVTFTGSTLLDGTTGANLTVTMTAFKGSAITVEARGTKWLLVSSSNVTSITT